MVPVLRQISPNLRQNLREGAAGAAQIATIAAMKILSLLPWLDWLALSVFVFLWASYTWYSHRSSTKQGATLLAMTNRYRYYWMEQATARDPRMVDGVITQSMSASPTFFASTTIIIIGGLGALLGTSERAAELVHELPFTVPTSTLVFDFKVMVIIAIFVYAFFRFTWSMRLYSFGLLAVGSMPPPHEFNQGKFDRHVFAERGSRLMGMAAETFNLGLRAYYFAFAAICWFFSPLTFICATLAVVVVLYNREFRSEVLRVLGD